MLTLRNAAKGVLLRTAGAVGLFPVARRAHRRCLAILAYHGVDEEPDRTENFDGFHVAPARFREHLDMLRKHYRVMPLDQIVSGGEGLRVIPDNAVAITFDDGYLNNAGVAAPILREYGFPATFFVTTGFVDGTHRPWWFRLRRSVFSVQCSVFSDPEGGKRPLASAADRVAVVVAWERVLKDMTSGQREGALASLGVADARDGLPSMMTWDDVRRLMGEGHSIGAHTVSHISSGHEPEAVMEREIAGSVDRIGTMTEERPRLFSYPYGEPQHFTAESAAMIRRAGCIGAVTTIEGLNKRGDDPIRLKRINVTGNHTAGALEWLLAGLPRSRCRKW
jgi:peptidoglycan/xylan/chitin deacetylase (PgdA/CDA1 family)